MSISKSKPFISSKLWGKADGKRVRLYTLMNSKGMIVEITNYGAIVVRIITPDRNGKFENVVLGFDNLTHYQKQNSAYMGAIIGRFANRIAKGVITLDDVQYHLATNDNTNHSHGGIKGFDKVVWDASETKLPDAAGIKLHYMSKAMEEGYPGNLEVEVTYELTNDDEFKISYEAKTDKPTILNLTHHSYFNLSGNRRNILDHKLTIIADHITRTDATWVPTGEIATVAGTVFDFRQAHAIGERIKHLPQGYNVNFVLLKNNIKTPVKAAEVADEVSGRLMEVYTTEPGLQLYTGDYLDSSLTGSGNAVFAKNMGLALEAQHFPDSPHHPDFPSTVLRPGETYTQLTIYKFSTK